MAACSETRVESVAAGVTRPCSGSAPRAAALALKLPAEAASAPAGACIVSCQAHCCAVQRQGCCSLLTAVPSLALTITKVLLSYFPCSNLDVLFSALPGLTTWHLTRAILMPVCFMQTVTEMQALDSLSSVHAATLPVEAMLCMLREWVQEVSAPERDCTMGATVVLMGTPSLENTAATAVLKMPRLLRSISTCSRPTRLALGASIGWVMHCMSCSVPLIEGSHW